MTIYLELKAEIAAQLAAEANAQGLSLEKVAERLLQEALASRSILQGTLSVEKFHGMLKSLASCSEALPNRAKASTRNAAKKNAAMNEDISELLITYREKEAFKLLRLRMVTAGRDTEGTAVNGLWLAPLYDEVSNPRRSKRNWCRIPTNVRRLASLLYQKSPLG